MLGAHPQMYDFPEVNLFVAEMMHQRRRQLPWPHQQGLLRAVAQLCYGDQSFRSVARAERWVCSRQSRACVSVFRELAEKVRPNVPIDKSPRTTMHCEYLIRLWRANPTARFIHLSRHPFSHIQSEQKRRGPWKTGAPSKPHPARRANEDGRYAMAMWHRRHSNVIAFLGGVPEEQKMSIRGEDLLNDPAPHLRRIAGWLDLRTDPEAIEAMMHPERSVYACVGPSNAPFGNNREFLAAPELRAGSFPTFDGALEGRRGAHQFPEEVVALAVDLGYT